MPHEVHSLATSKHYKLQGRCKTNIMHGPGLHPRWSTQGAPVDNEWLGLTHGERNPLFWRHQQDQMHIL